MNKPSSTITAAAISGAIAAVAFGVLSVFGPEYYARVPAGMEAGVSVLVAVAFGYFKKENVLVK
jgi:hypothetical protein